MTPLFDKTTYYSMIIAGDQTDVYLPQLKEKESPDTTCPVVLFLQGFEVDKSCYAQFARQIARYGFLVLIPNHLPVGRPFLAPEVHHVSAIIASLTTDMGKANFPLAGRLNLQHVIIMGHSCGGLTGLKVLRQQAISPQSSDHAHRAAYFAGGVFYGSQLTTWEMSERTKLAIALISGSLDEIVPPESTRRTYQSLPSVPKAYMIVKGANHYGITDMIQPPDGSEERLQPLLTQEVSIHTVAYWSAMFMRAYMLNDDRCRAYFSSGECELDEHTSLSLFQETVFSNKR